MLDFATAFLAWAAATLIPAFVGMLIITLARKTLQPRHLVAFAFGIFFWFFVDTISGSATLDVNTGFGGGAAQIGVVVLFILGIVLMFGIDRKRDILSPKSAVGKYGMVIPFLVAIAVGLHGLGEGVAFGGTANATTGTSLLDTFGGLTAGVAYFLHKALEPMMIGACYNIYFKAENVSSKRFLSHVSLLTFVFAVTSLIGAAAGYFISLDTTYFFALGTGTSIYAAFRLAGPLFASNGDNLSEDSIKIALSLILGFLSIYVAALFHS
jgi:hypothetical protein